MAAINPRHGIFAETLRCPSCKLVQFVNAAETCKRCGKILKLPVPIPAIKPAKRHTRPRGVVTVILNTPVLTETMEAIRVLAQMQKCGYGEIVDRLVRDSILKSAEEAMHKEAR